MADNGTRVAAQAGAAGAGTDWLRLRGEGNYFDLSVRGSFSATVTLQRKRPREAASEARDVERYTGPVERLGEMQGHWDVRLWVKAGEYTSGTADLELGT